VPYTRVVYKLMLVYTNIYGFDSLASKHVDEMCEWLTEHA
jgi:hypothetical protein